MILTIHIFSLVVGLEGQPLWKVVGHLAICMENGQWPIVIFKSALLEVSLLFFQEDKCWEWDKLFAELSPDIQAVWDQLAMKGEGGKSISSNSTEGVVSLPGNIL